MKQRLFTVLAVAAMQAVAFASCKEDGKKPHVAVTGVTLNRPTAMLTAGKTLTLTATVLPRNATDKTVTWTSIPTSVATVENGVVTAVAAGIATITVTTQDGAKTNLCTVTIVAGTADGGTQIVLGTRTFTYYEKSARGTPVISMWKAQMPTSDRLNAAGLPIPQGVKHHDVWKPSTREEGAYNHYSNLIFHNGRFHAMWANHQHGEDAPSQRILYSTSGNGAEWTKPIELFPAPGPVLLRGVDGIHLKPDRWAEVDGKLYAIVYVFYPTTYPIAREVAADGTFGEPFLVRTFPSGAALPTFMPEQRYLPDIAAKINQWYTDHSVVSWWARLATTAGEKVPSRTVDGAGLIESSGYRSSQGRVVFYRDYSEGDIDPKDYKYSNRIYASFEDGAGGWSAPYPTDIPDAHSRAHAVRLPDGRVLLIGNQVAYQFDSGLTVLRDPLTLSVSPDGEFFTKVFALCSGAPTTRRISGVTGRNTGFSYPCMIVHEDTVYVLHSIGKEDMAIASVPLSSIK